MNSPADLLKKTLVEVSNETFFLISLDFQKWLKLLENPALSPRGSAPFMILRDKHEVTLLLDEIDYTSVRENISDAKIERGFRLLTFNIELDWNTVGYFSLISKILADNQIAIGAISAFSRDHILIKQQDLAKTLKVLGDYIEDLC